jgi:hypothetical protein
LITQRSLLPMPALRTFAKTEMPKRFAFFCATLLFLSASAFAQSTTPAATTAERTLWDHNGSVMYLVENGSSREFYYQKPRPGMLEAGAHPDSLLFRGQLNDGHISGTAFLFNANCGQVPFAVKGTILDNGAKVVLTGQAPHIGRNCQASGEYTSTLEFKLLKTTEVAQTPPATAPTPNIENSKPELPSTDAGEPKLPSAQSAQPTPPTHTPSVEQPKPEVSEPNKATIPSDQPSLATSAPVALQGFDKNFLAPLIIAMNVVLPLLSILFLIWMLRSNETSPSLRAGIERRNSRKSGQVEEDRYGKGRKETR